MREDRGAGLRVQRMKVDRIELVVPHDRARGTCVDHAADYIDHLAVPRAAIYEIAQEEARSVGIGVAPGAAAWFVAELGETRDQLVRLTVNVGNDVVQVKILLMTERC